MPRGVSGHHCKKCNFLKDAWQGGCGRRRGRGPKESQTGLDLAATYTSPSSSVSLSEAHSSPMSGRAKNRVLGPGPGGIQALGSCSSGAGWRGLRGLKVELLLQVAPLIDGSTAQTPPGPGGGRARATRWAGEPATLQPPLAEARGRVWGEGCSRGWSKGWTLAALGLLGSE